MRNCDLISGLEILQKYYMSEGSYNIGAEHDVIYAYATDQELSYDDVRSMIAFGWHQEGQTADGEDFSFKDYNQEESWVAYI